MKYIDLILAVCLCLPACQPKADPELAKKEILQTESDFEKMAAERGIAEAFYFYADSNAVILRGNDSIIAGKENIRQFYQQEKYKKVTLTWTPGFVEVSSGGDLGYTYGTYLWVIQTDSGRQQNFKGVFHTVWKRQGDKSWKYVWD